MRRFLFAIPREGQSQEADDLREAKNTQRAIVKIGYDGKVHKTFRGPKAEERFANEVRVLRYLEERKCPFVPRLLDFDESQLKIVTSNCGQIVEHIDEDRAREIFGELENYGVRHDDAFARNITYRASDGRFCAIDFEFATILDEDWQDAEVQAENAPSKTEANQIEWSGLTDPGTARPNNEDAFLAMMLDRHGIQYLGKTGKAELSETQYIFAVSDGMGGENSGEFASRIAIDKITLQLPQQFGVAEERFHTHSKDVLGDLFSSIHQAMLDLGRHDYNCRNMGATLTLVWLRNGRLYFAHIGDSRLYRIRAESTIEQITHDHSHVGWLRRNGKINEREARHHPRKNALDQALGAGHRYLNPQIGALEYQPGDKFILCTDGVNDGLWDNRIEDLVNAVEPGRTAAESLVLHAVQESGRDNATAVVIEASSL